MFLPPTDADITPEEFDTKYAPLLDACYDYLEEELIPLYVSFYIDLYYRSNVIEEDTYDIFINSALDRFNGDYKNFATIKAKTTKLLLDKYKLKVVGEDPLSLEEVRD